jgi:hypothetical protein
MHYLHTLNPPILHRDLKSPNILVRCTFPPPSPSPLPFTFV